MLEEWHSFKKASHMSATVQLDHPVLFQFIWSLWLSYIGNIMTAMVVEDYNHGDMFFNYTAGCLIYIPVMRRDKGSWSSFPPLKPPPLYPSPLPVWCPPACPQSWEPVLEWRIPPGLWDEARPIISWPHSRWLDSCRPRPVVSMGRAQEAMAANRQQQQ